MGDYIDVRGVRTWYDVRGTGEPLVLLHGGFSDSRDFEPNLAGLADTFRVYRLDRRGHGRTPDVPGPITHEVMAEDVIAFLDTVVGEPVRLAGYSDGAVIALLVALARPDLVSRLVVISGTHRPGGWIIAPDSEVSAMPDVVVDRYAEVSPDGREHFAVFAAKVLDPANVHPELGPDDLARLECRTLVLSGDDDLVHLEDTIALYRGLPAGELGVVPGTSHGLLWEKPELCTRMVRTFLIEDPVPSLIPLRRAAASP